MSTTQASTSYSTSTETSSNSTSITSVDDLQTQHFVYEHQLAEKLKRRRGGLVRARVLSEQLRQHEEGRGLLRRRLHETSYLPAGNPPGANQYPLGSSICILVYLQNLRSQNTSLPSVETVKVTSSNNSASTGLIFYEFSCSVPGSDTGSLGPIAQGGVVSRPGTRPNPSTGFYPPPHPPIISISNSDDTMADSYVIQVEFSFGFTT